MPVITISPTPMGSCVKPIDASSSQYLLKELRQIDISVPLRTEGRTTEDCERWSMCRFLASFSDSSLLSYPMSLIHRDKPDFLLRMEGVEVGVEVTEAISENAAAIAAYRETMGIDGPFSLKRHRPNEPKLQGKDLRNAARAVQQGDIWGGDSVERDWADAMENAIQDKIATSQKPGFEHFQSNWLVMYDGWTLPQVDRREATKRLSTTMQHRGFGPFEFIFIEGNKHFWVLNRERAFVQPINDVWLR